MAEFTTVSESGSIVTQSSSLEIEMTPKSETITFQPTSSTPPNVESSSTPTPSRKRLNASRLKSSTSVTPKKSYDSNGGLPEEPKNRTIPPDNEDMEDDLTTKLPIWAQVYQKGDRLKAIQLLLKSHTKKKQQESNKRTRNCSNSDSDS